MGDWGSGTYIASQVITILAYLFLASTFFIKKRWVILCLGLAFSTLMMISCILLSAWVGAGMFAIGIVRNPVLYIIDRYKSPENKNRIMLVDWIVLAVLTIAIVVTTWFTQEGWYTWFGFLASYAFTIAIWQKNVLVYRLLGFLSEVFWITYHAVVDNLMGVIFAGAMASVILVGIMMYIATRRRRCPAPELQGHSLAE